MPGREPVVSVDPVALMVTAGGVESILGMMVLTSDLLHAEHTCLQPGLFLLMLCSNNCLFSTPIPYSPLSQEAAGDSHLQPRQVMGW